MAARRQTKVCRSNMAAITDHQVNVVQSEKLLSCATRRLTWDIPQYPSIRGDYYAYWFEFNTCVFNCVTSNDTKPYAIMLSYIYFALNHVWFQCQSFTNFILIWKKQTKSLFLLDLFCISRLKLVSFPKMSLTQFSFFFLLCLVLHFEKPWSLKMPIIHQLAYV